MYIVFTIFREYIMLHGTRIYYATSSSKLLNTSLVVLLAGGAGGQAGPGHLGPHGARAHVVEHQPEVLLGPALPRPHHHGPGDGHLAQRVVLGSAVIRSISFTIGVYNHGKGPYKGLLLVESPYLLAL